MTHERKEMLWRAKQRVAADKEYEVRKKAVKALQKRLVLCMLEKFETFLKKIKIFLAYVKKTS